MIVECFNERGEPRAIELDPANRAYGWVYYKHADGHWVTLRKATLEEVERAQLHRRSEAILREWAVGRLSPS
jgi:hypothetical protein